MDISTLPAWLTHFPALAAIRDPHWARIAASAQTVTLPPGTTVFREGEACRQYVLVLAGSIRVQKVSESGKEIVLYRVEAGETCVLTTSCLFAGERYPAEGITETETTAVVLPLDRFQEALAHSEPFRRFVFSSFGDRLAELVVLVEEIAFGRLDARLAQRLLALGKTSSVLVLTHQQLAAELGTAREVVSRLLKEFERHGWLRLQRGQIEIVDPIPLRSIAEGVPG